MKSKRHTEHFTFNTKFTSVQLERAQKIHYIPNFVQSTLVVNWRVSLLLTLKFNSQMLLCLVFLWKTCVLCPLLAGKREEERCFLQIRGSFHLPGNGRATQTFSISTALVTSSSSSTLATSPLPLVVKVLQYSTSTDHPVAVLAWPLTEWKKTIIKNIHIKAKSTLQILLHRHVFTMTHYLMLDLPNTLRFLLFLHRTHKLGVTLFRSMKACEHLKTYPASKLFFTHFRVETATRPVMQEVLWLQFTLVHFSHRWWIY